MDSNTPIDPATTSPAAATPAAGTPVANSSNGTAYVIPQVVLDKYPELVDLIKKTESMSDDERNYWFQILPIMTDEQVNRLKTILNEEAQQLSKLDDQYQDELAKLNKKHLEEWNQFEHKQQNVELKKAEEAEKAKEAQVQEELLKQLDQAAAPTPPNP